MEIRVNKQWVIYSSGKSRNGGGVILGRIPEQKQDDLELDVSKLSSSNLYHYATVFGAVQGLFRYGVNDTDVKSLAELETEIKRIAQECQSAFIKAQPVQDPILDKPAAVGNGTFQKGVKWSTVIGAAQRHYENDGRHERPVISVRDQLRIASGHSVIMPIEVTDKMVESIDALPDGCTIDEIYKAMIKAVKEQNHDQM